MPNLPRISWGAGQRRALLVHGLSSSSADWWHVGEALADEGWAVTAVDLRGHGAAPQGDRYRLADYAADLPAEEWDLVMAHSIGAAAAVLAAAAPGFARRLVLLDPPLHVDAARRDQLMRGELDELGLTEDALRAAKPHWHDRHIAAKLDAIRAVSPEAVARSFSDNPDWDLRDAVAALELPVLIVGGDPDVFTLLPRELGRDLADRNPLIRYAVIPGTGHALHRDAPDATMALVLGWLDEI